MSHTSDPALYASNYERRPGDRYWTEPWVTSALLRGAPHGMPDRVWDPAAGRGDLLRVLSDQGHSVVASDVDLSEFDFGLCPWSVHDFLEEWPPEGFLEGEGDYRAVVTNPPYTLADQFVRRALAYIDSEEVEVVAMLLRAEWNHAARRQDLFGRPDFACEVVLTSRPRWDWWFREQPEASPRHNFSWFVWDRRWNKPYPIQRFEGRERRKS